MNQYVKLSLKFMAIFLIALFCSEDLIAQRQKISYYPLTANQPDSTANPREVVSDKAHLRAQTNRDYDNLISSVAPEYELVNLNSFKYYRIAELPHHPVYYQEIIPADTAFEYSGKIDTILGYPCRHARMMIFSNTVEFWVADELPFKATPYPSIGIADGSVLKVLINGSGGYEAFKVEHEKGGVFFPELLGEELSQTEYQKRLRDNHVRKIDVFSDVQLSFGNPIHNPVNHHADSVFHYSKGTVALKKVALPALYNHTVFLKLSEKSAGDAYDRTGSVFLIRPSHKITFLDALLDSLQVLPVMKDNNGKEYHGFTQTSGYEPPVELLRFFTPFGVGHFNDKRQVSGLQWQDSAYYEQDVSSAVIPFSEDEVWIGVYIANYDKGGHRVSLSLDAHPNSQSKSTQPDSLWALPLFQTLNIMEMSGQEYSRFFDNDTLCVDFEIPDHVEDLQLRYISTGHGGWAEGDEFTPKVNTILIDDEEVYSYTPWREDCSVYRPLNPASGNFWNGISSSDLSRSGWCPGAATNPEYITLPGLEPGKHTIKVIIPQGEPEENSFSSWNVSGLLTGKMKE